MCTRPPPHHDRDGEAGDDVAFEMAARVSVAHDAHDGEHVLDGARHVSSQDARDAVLVLLIFTFRRRRSFRHFPLFFLCVNLVCVFVCVCVASARRAVNRPIFRGEERVDELWKRGGESSRRIRKRVLCVRVACASVCDDDGAQRKRVLLLFFLRTFFVFQSFVMIPRPKRHFDIICHVIERAFFVISCTGALCMTTWSFGERKVK